MEAGTGNAEEHAKQLAAGAAFATARGVSDARNGVWLNGAVTKATPGLPWRSLVSYLLNAEVQRMQVSIRTVISDTGVDGT